MRIPGAKTVQEWWRKLRAQLIDHAVILGYHRVDTAPWDPYSLSVSPNHFEEQLSWLSRYTSTISLPDLVDRLRSGGKLNNTVALTFDDGYADNLYRAWPLLDAFGVPATIFVTTGNPGREFWWDELARLVHAVPKAGKRLEVALSSEVRSWDLRDFLEGNQIRDGMAGRRRLLDDVFRLCRSLAPAQRSEVLSQLRGQVDPIDVEPWHRALTLEEITTIGENELIEIGVHTVTHPVLTALDREEQEREILQGKQALESLSSSPAVTFSFPYGAVSTIAADCLAAAGFACACTSAKDVVAGSSNPLQLPRIWVQDEGSRTFSRWLRGWVGKSPTGFPRMSESGEGSRRR